MSAGRFHPNPLIPAVEPLENRQLLSSAAGFADLQVGITASSLPSAVVSGGHVAAMATVALQNTGETTESGVATVSLYAASDGAVDGSATSLASVTRNLVLRPNATVRVVVPIRMIPASLNGQYTLLALASDGLGNATASASGPTFTGAAPFLSFSETVVRSTLPAAPKAGRTPTTVELKVTNNGNVTPTGRSTLAAFLSPDGNAADGTAMNSVAEPPVLRPGASRVVIVPLKQVPALAAGTYAVVVQVTDPDGNVTSAATAAVYSLAGGGGGILTTFSVVNTGLTNSGSVPGVETGYVATPNISVNASGQVTGTDSATGKAAVFVPASGGGGTIVDLGTDVVRAMNGNNQFLINTTIELPGSMTAPGGPLHRPVLVTLQGNTATLVNPTDTNNQTFKNGTAFGFWDASALNDNGVGTGLDILSNPAPGSGGGLTAAVAYSIQGGQLMPTFLPNLGPPSIPSFNNSNAVAINASGMIVGESPLLGRGSFNQFHTGTALPTLWTADSSGKYAATQITPTADGAGIANGINDSGMIVGQVSKGAGAFVRPAGATMARTILVPALSGGDKDDLLAVNNAGIAVGSSNLARGGTDTHAVAWVPNGKGGGSLVDLNTLLPANSGWVLQQATSINNAGQIAGIGTFNGSPAVFLLDPSGM